MTQKCHAILIPEEIGRKTLCHLKLSGRGLYIL